MLSTKTNILITAFFALFAFTLIENQIVQFTKESTERNPEIAGASIGAIVEPTPLNTGWEELRKEQEKLNQEKAKLDSSKTQFSALFQPTEQSIRVLYIFLFLLFALVTINLILDLYILFNKKRKTHA